MKRKIVQITGVGTDLFVLDADGNLWERTYKGWELHGGLPDAPDLPRVISDIEVDTKEDKIKQAIRHIEHHIMMVGSENTGSLRAAIKTLRGERMLRGKTEVETLRLNGWGVGDVLEGDEGTGPDRIKITALGEENFFCRWQRACTGEFGKETGNTTLNHRNWERVEYP